MTQAAQVLDDLDSGLAEQMARLEARRRIIGWLRENAEEAAHLGFAVACEVQESGVTLRIDWTGGVVPVPLEHPDGDRPATLIDADPADLAPVAVPQVAETPAQEAVQPPGDRADGGGDSGVAAPVEAQASAYGAAWSAEEDALLVREVARLQRAGAKRKGLLLEVAAMLPGRTPVAIEYRVKTKLRDLVEAAIQSGGPAVPEAVPLAPASDPTPVPAVLPRWQRDLAQRLDSLNARKPQPAAVDLALVEGKAKGIGTTVIADRTGLSTAVLTERYHLLLPVKTIEATERLLIELRRRVALEQGVAA